MVAALIVLLNLVLDVYKIILDLNNILITLHTDPYTNLFTIPNALFELL